MAKLTPKQQQICDFIRNFTRDRGYPPTMREIGSHLGLKSPSTVYFHIKRLQEAGILKVAEGKTRAITLAEETAAPPKDQIPVLGNQAAGAPILAEEYIEEYIPYDVGSRSGEYFALKVRGESMLNAGILPDDLVVVHRQMEAHNGEIVVALFEDEATVKTLSRKDGEVWLLPENPKYSPIDGDRASVIGVVRAVIRTY